MRKAIIKLIYVSEVPCAPVQFITSNVVQASMITIMWYLTPYYQSDAGPCNVAGSARSWNSPVIPTINRTLHSSSCKIPAEPQAIRCVQKHALLRHTNLRLSLILRSWFIPSLLFLLLNSIDSEDRNVRKYLYRSRLLRSSPHLK
jgi:hypothetical protein